MSLELWCCDIPGRGEVLACESRQLAQKVADAINDWVRCNPGFDSFHTEVKPWTGSPMTHAHYIEQPPLEYVQVLNSCRALLQ